MKSFFCTMCGVSGAAFAALFGGWDEGLITLLIFMAIDWITGLIVAGIFHKSSKSETGRLESQAGLKGLFRKGMILFFVLIGYRLDLVIGMDIVRDAVVIGFLANELISVTENAALMGVPVPKVITRAIDVLHDKEDEIDGK